MSKETFNLSTINFKLKRCGLALEKLKQTIKVLNEQKFYLKNKAKIVSFVEYKKISKEINEAQLKLTQYIVENDELLKIKTNYEKNPNQKP